MPAEAIGSEWKLRAERSVPQGFHKKTMAEVDIFTTQVCRRNLNPFILGFMIQFIYTVSILYLNFKCNWLICFARLGG